MGEIYSRPYRTQEDLINSLKERHLQSGRIEEAFRRVDRAHFMPEAERDNAYSDTAWRHEELHLSAPSIYATVLSHLEPQPGQSFLNLGSGTGYFSTIVGLLIGPHGINHGVEVKPTVLEHAVAKVKEFRETAPEDYYTAFSVPEFFLGNFFSICPSSRRYDLIYCGAGISSKEELFSLRSLLNVNGRFIVPYRNALISVTLTAENKFVTNNLMSVAFSQAIPTSPEHSDSSIVLPSPRPESLLHLASIIIRRRVASRMLEERGRPGLRIVSYTRAEPRPPPHRRHQPPHPQPPSNEEGGARLRPLLLSDVDTDDEEDDDSDAEGGGGGGGGGDDDDHQHGPGGGGGGERNALGPDMRRLYLFLRSLHTQEVAFSLASAEERLNAQIARHRAEAEADDSADEKADDSADADEAEEVNENDAAEATTAAAATASAAAADKNEKAGKSADADEKAADKKENNDADEEELDAEALADAAADAVVEALEDALATAEAEAAAVVAAAAAPSRSCKRGLDGGSRRSGSSSESSSASGGCGGGGGGSGSGDHRERSAAKLRRSADGGEAAKKSRRGEGPLSAWAEPSEQPVEMDVELEEGSLSLRLSRDRRLDSDDDDAPPYLVRRLGRERSTSVPDLAESSSSSEGSERSAPAVRESSGRASSTGSGSTEGPDERPPFIEECRLGPVREVLSEPRYDSLAEIRSRFETLPLPPPLKQYLMMSR